MSVASSRELERRSPILRQPQRQWPWCDRWGWSAVNSTFQLVSL
ncbi:MAG: hypothetical protein AAF622_05055 [Cyanobacteria bacterium P01_C01_bin.147]